MFQIVCLAKFTPDIKNFVYDYEKNILVRENVNLILNPDDACAISLALKLKEKWDDVHIRVVSMGPKGTMNLVRDLLRLGVDEATLLSDAAFAGSDTFATSHVLGSYLDTVEYDLVLTGTHTLDGDTAHVPSQIADYLSLAQMVGITDFHLDACTRQAMQFDVKQEDHIFTYQVQLPALLGVAAESKMKLPFVRYDDLEKFVDDKITILGNDTLGVPAEVLGLKGSPTRVVKTHVKELEKKENISVQVNEEGVETVYQFLKAKGFIKDV